MKNTRLGTIDPDTAANLKHWLSAPCRHHAKQHFSITECEAFRYNQPCHTASYRAVPCRTASYRMPQLGHVLIGGGGGWGGVGEPPRPVEWVHPVRGCSRRKSAAQTRSNVRGPDGDHRYDSGIYCVNGSLFTIHTASKLNNRISVSYGTGIFNVSDKCLN